MKREIVFILPLLLFLSCSPKQLTWIDSNIGDYTVSIPEDYLIKTSDVEIILTHNIKHKHADECDYISRSINYYLTDLNWILINYNKNLSTIISEYYPSLKEYLLDDSHFILIEGFIDEVNINGILGYRITSEWDGCGEVKFFLINDNKVLLVKREHSELRTTSPIKVEWSKLPGIIQIEEEEMLFNIMLNSIQK